MYAKAFFIWSVLFVCNNISTAFSPDIAEPEEILLELQVENLLVFDLDGYLVDEELYLPLKELLSHLNIKFHDSDNLHLKAEFPDEEHSLKVDFSNHTIQSGGKTHSFTQEDWLSDIEYDIYIKKDWIEEVFEVKIIFDYKRLLVMLFSEHDLPVIMDYRRREQYESFQKTEVNIAPDKTYKPRRHFLSGGTVDWSVNSLHSAYQQNYSHSMALGGQVFGGVASLSFRGNEDRIVDENNLRAFWRLPVYNTPVIRQIIAGDQTHKTPYAEGSRQYRGIEITNRPNAPRRNFSLFKTANELPQGWDVELYSNNRLIDFARSQNTEKFNFTEPLNYGSNRYTLRYYSPDGFSHEENYHILIPPTFLPAGEIEYSLSGGSYRNREQNFAMGHLRMGLSSSLTIGGGSQLIFDPVFGDEHIPFAETSAKLGDQFLIEAGHAFEYRSHASLLYTFQNSQNISVQLQKFYKSSRFNLSRKVFEGALNTSFPVKLGRVRFSTFINARNIHFEKYQDINLNSGITASLPFGYMLQLRSGVMFRNHWQENTDLIRSDVTITASKRVLNKILLRPTLDYNHRSGRISEYGLDASSRIFSYGNISMSARYDQLTSQYRFLVNFRYNLPYARHQSQVRGSGAANSSYSQITSGTLAWNKTGGGFETDNRSWNGRATLKIEPYLVGGESEDGNYIKESADQLEITVYDALMLPRSYKGDMIKSLTPYRKYLVKVHSDGFDNPLWKLQAETFSVTVLPNVINTLPIPVVAVGEISGGITSTDMNTSLQGLSVKLSRKDDSFSKTIQTYSDGQFYYVGLEPGEYTATLDPQQVQDRLLKIEQDSTVFKIEPTIHGDIVDGLTLKVSSADENSISEIFYIQTGAFLQRDNAVKQAEFIDLQTAADGEVLFDPVKQLYLSRAGLFHSEAEASSFLDHLRNEYPDLFEDAFIIRKDL